MSKGVFVYRNLHYRDRVVWSLRSNKTGRVVSRRGYVVIRDAKLKVSQAGRQRVLREGRKNVHAGISGTWVRGDIAETRADTRSFINEETRKGWVRVRYNPRKTSTFVREDTGWAVTKAAFVVLDEDGAWAYMPS